MSVFQDVWFRFHDWTHLRRWTSICILNFDKISIHGRAKTTSSFGKRMAAILEYYFRFQFWPNFRHRRLILHRRAQFRQNRTTLGGVMTSCRFFSRWRPAAILDFIWAVLDHPRSAIVVLSLVLKFGVDPIYSFWDMAIFISWRFGLKLHIPAHFGGIWGPRKGTSLLGNTSFET